MLCYRIHSLTCFTWLGNYNTSYLFPTLKVARLGGQEIEHQMISGFLWAWNFGCLVIWYTDYCLGSRMGGTGGCKRRRGRRRGHIAQFWRPILIVPIIFQYYTVPRSQKDLANAAILTQFCPYVMYLLWEAVLAHCNRPQGSVATVVYKVSPFFSYYSPTIPLQWHHNRKARAQRLLSNVQVSTGDRKTRLWLYPLWKRLRCWLLLRSWRRLLVRLYSSLKLPRYELARIARLVFLTEFTVYR